MSSIYTYRLESFTQPSYKTVSNGSSTIAIGPQRDTPHTMEGGSSRVVLESIALLLTGVFPCQPNMCTAVYKTIVGPPTKLDIIGFIGSIYPVYGFWLPDAYNAHGSIRRGKDIFIAGYHGPLELEYPDENNTVDVTEFLNFVLDRHYNLRRYNPQRPSDGYKNVEHPTQQQRRIMKRKDSHGYSCLRYRPEQHELRKIEELRYSVGRYRKKTY